jgi:uncharacterized membrane protein YtjA (UPF0391 family)
LLGRSGARRQWISPESGPGANREAPGGTSRADARFSFTNEIHEWRSLMGGLLHYAILFLVVAIVAAFFGFGGVAGTAMEGARLLFWVAVVLFVVSAVLGFLRRA